MSASTICWTKPPTTHLWVMEACAALRPICGGHSPDTSDNAGCGMSCTRCADDRTYRIHQHDRPVRLCGSVRWRSSPQAARRVNDEFCGISRRADERHRRLQSEVAQAVPVRWKPRRKTCSVGYHTTTAQRFSSTPGITRRARNVSGTASCG